MWKTLRILGLLVLVVGFAPAVGADSHEAPPTYVWVSTVTAQPGQGDALIELLMEDAALYDPLVESGAAYEWGLGIPVVHDGGDSGVRVQWVTFAGWDGADQFMNAFMARMQSMSEDARKANMEKWESIVEPGSHADVITRSVHVGAGQMARPAYIHLDYRTAKPNMGVAASAFYKQSVAPVFDQVLADGKILAYGLHVPAVPRGQGWTHMGWFSSANLAARDAVDGAFDAMMAGLSPQEREAWIGGLTGVLEPGHTEQIIMVVHHKMASGGGQEGSE